MARIRTLALANCRIAATLAGAVLMFAFYIQSMQPAGAQVSGDTNRDNSEKRYFGQIVGGTAVPNGKYPFVTAILGKKIPGTVYDKQLCGGTLISSDKVLTAAHCVSGAGAKDLQTATGRTVLDSSQGQIRNVSRVKIHPRYNVVAGTNRYDVAVLKLNRPLTNVQPVKLANASQNNLEKPGSVATIAGWGNTKAQSAAGSGEQNYPQRMREARVPLVSDSDAKQSYSNYVPALMVAAGKVGKDSCYGDSGGPMFARTVSGYTQIGIASFGIGCAAPGYPGVYTEINDPRIKSFITAQLANATSNSQTASISQSSIVSINQSNNQMISINQITPFRASSGRKAWCLRSCPRVQTSETIWPRNPSEYQHYF